MLKKLLVAVILLVVLECVATVLLYQAIGWLAIPAVLAANLVLLFILKKVIGRLITKAFTAPFKAKGAVLRGATAEIHSVTPASAPLRRKDDEDDDEDSASEAGPLVHYLIDVTVTPAASDGPFQMWEPCSIQLALSTAKADDTDGDDEAGEIHAVRIWQDDAFVDDEGMKFPGPQRLELHVGVAPAIREVRFRYYFELFGTVRFPSSTSAASG